MSQQTTTTLNRRQRRSYDAARREKKSVEVEFEITAELADGSERKEVFVARPGRIPGSILVDFMRLGVYHDSEGMWNVFRCALGKPVKDADDDLSEYERFRTFVDDPNVAVEAETLGNIITDMVEDSSGFPTQPQSG